MINHAAWDLSTITPKVLIAFRTIFTKLTVQITRIIIRLHTLTRTCTTTQNTTDPKFDPNVFNIPTSSSATQSDAPNQSVLPTKRDAVRYHPHQYAQPRLHLIYLFYFSFISFFGCGGPVTSSFCTVIIDLSKPRHGHYGQYIRDWRNGISCQYNRHFNLLKYRCYHLRHYRQFLHHQRKNSHQ